MATDSFGSSNPVAIVTGVSRGFGRAVTEVLLAADWIVVGNGRDGVALEAMLAGRKERRLRLLQGDIMDRSHLRALVSTAESLGPLKLLVNSAGALGPSPLPPLAEVAADAFESLLQVNTVAPLRLIQLALPGLSANSGSIVNVSSDAAVESYPGWGAYGATKAALERLTFVLGVESPRVRVYALDPGDMRTDMHQAAYPGEDISDRPEPSASAPAVVRLSTGQLPSGRYRASDLLRPLPDA